MSLQRGVWHTLIIAVRQIDHLSELIVSLDCEPGRRYVSSKSVSGIKYEEGDRLGESGASGDVGKGGKSRERLNVSEIGRRTNIVVRRKGDIYDGNEDGKRRKGVRFKNVKYKYNKSYRLKRDSQRSVGHLVIADIKDPLIYQNTRVSVIIY